MRHAFSKAVLALSLVVLVGRAPQAAADTIFVSGYTMAKGSELVSLSGSSVAGANGSYTAGQFTLTANYGTTGNPAGHFNLLAWCIDLFHTINNPTNQVYASGALANDSSGPPPNALTAQQANQISWLAAQGNAALASGPNEALSAAYQAAIWSVEYGATADGSAAFDAYYGAIMTGLPANAGWAGGSAIFATDSQGVILSQGMMSTLVPEPASMLLLLPGVLGLVAMRRGRNAAG